MPSRNEHPHGRQTGKKESATEEKQVPSAKPGAPKKHIVKAQPAKGTKKSRRKGKPDKLLGASTAAYVRSRGSLLGDLFYNLGFYAEYYVLQFGRVARDAGIFLAQILVWIFGGTLGKLADFVRELLRDITSPLTRQKHAQHREAGDEDAPYISERRRKKKSGTQGALAVLQIITRLLLPVAAAAALAVTVHTVFSMNYALAVQVDGEIIGYVSDESVLEDAQNILRMKIQLAPNQKLSEWQFEPTLTIGTTETISNKTEIADEILRHSSNEIMEANGVYVNDVLVGVTTEGDRVNELLAGMIEAYTDTETYPDATVDFVKDVTVSPDGGVFFTDSVQTYEEVEQLLTSTVRDEIRHTATGGETLEEIANAGGITLEALRMRNPEFADARDNFEPEAGTSILLERAQPYLQVKMSFRRTQVEPIPYDTIEEQTGNLLSGTRRVQTPGVEGEQIVQYDEEYIDGELARRVRLDEETQVLREPIAEVVLVGTFQVGDMPGGIGGYSPIYMYPVPDATGSSRGFIPGAHRGLDINAPTGTPIYSSNAGTVVFSGWHWSWGWYVEIEHEDGLHTLYAHCTDLYVKEGDVVGQFALIASVGSTGVSTGPHCHFEIQVDGVPVDPYGFVSAPAEYKPR